MEDRWHGPEDPTNEDSESTHKKRRGPDFLTQFLLRRKESQGEKGQEDDEDESTEKPKKFRRFFKNLFKNVVEPPVGEKTSTPKAFSLESFFMEHQDRPESRSTGSEPEFLSTDSESHGQEDITHQGAIEQATKANSELPDTELPTLIRTEVDPSVPQSVMEITQENVNQADRSVERPSWQDRTVFERAQTPPAEKEVIIERGNSMALPVVLVGAEYLARKKADSKLDAKFEQKVNKLEIDNKQRTFATEQLDTLVKQNKEQLESLKRGRGIDSTPERPIVRERVEAAAEQRSPEVHKTLRPTPEKQPEIVTKDDEKTDTYKIMEQVAEAAEHDVPVERVFERSHEVKDDENTPVGAASIGTIMADQVAKQRLSVQPQTSSHKDVSGLPVVSDKAQAVAYKQAMRNGFWTAIIIIILGTLAYLLK